MAEHEIYLAGGCFWGTEAFMKRLPGIVSTQAGYANARIECPSYEQVCTGETGAAETVRVVYDPAAISLALVLEAYFETIDPTSLNRQGNDVGTQYRTGIYWTDAADMPVVESELSKLARKVGRPLRIEARELANFFPAEDYHQDYLEKNPFGYCHVDLRKADEFVRVHAADFGT